MEAVWLMLQYEEADDYIIATGEGNLGTGVFGGSVLIRRTRLATARED